MTRLGRMLPRSRRQGCAVAAVASLLFVVLAEGMLRARGYATRVAVWYDPSVGFRALPNQERWMLAGGGQPVARVSINALGLRGPLAPRERRPGVRRVVTLGDSYTFGVGVEDDETYPARLRDVLAETLGDAEVLNVSFPSWNVRDALRAYREIARPYGPDVVVFGFTNDDMAPTNPGVRYTDNVLYRSVGRTALAQAFLMRGLARLPGYHVEVPPELADLHREWRKHPVRIQRSPRDPRYRPLWDGATAALDELASAVRADGAELLVLFFPRWEQVAAARDPDGSARVPPDTVGGLRAWAEASDVDYLDMLAPLAATRGDPQGAIAKGHPSAEGYAAVAAAVAAELARRWSTGR